MSAEQEAHTHTFDTGHQVEETGDGGPDGVTAYWCTEATCAWDIGYDEGDAPTAPKIIKGAWVGVTPVEYHEPNPHVALGTDDLHRRGFPEIKYPANFDAGDVKVSYDHKPLTLRYDSTAIREWVAHNPWVEAKEEPAEGRTERAPGHSGPWAIGGYGVGPEKTQAERAPTFAEELDALDDRYDPSMHELFTATLSLTRYSQDTGASDEALADMLMATLDTYERTVRQARR